MIGVALLVEHEIENIRASSNVKNASLCDVFSPLYRKHLIIGLTLSVAQVSAYLVVSYAQYGS